MHRKQGEIEEKRQITPEWWAVGVISKRMYKAQKACLGRP